MNKKQLYESIMHDMQDSIKKTLNEAINFENEEGRMIKMGENEKARIRTLLKRDNFPVELEKYYKNNLSIFLIEHNAFPEIRSMKSPDSLYKYTLRVSNNATIKIPIDNMGDQVIFNQKCIIFNRDVIIRYLNTDDFDAMAILLLYGCLYYNYLTNDKYLLGLPRHLENDAYYAIMQNKILDDIINQIPEAKQIIENDEFLSSTHFSDYDIRYYISDNRYEYESVNNKIDKKELYESIMRKVSQEVKKALNENNNLDNEKIPIIMTGSPEVCTSYSTKAKWLRAHPQYVVTTSWKDCQILFCDDLNSNSVKMQKAKQSGIEIRLYDDNVNNNINDNLYDTEELFDDFDTNNIVVTDLDLHYGNVLITNIVLNDDNAITFWSGDPEYDDNAEELIIPIDIKKQLYSQIVEEI